MKHSIVNPNKINQFQDIRRVFKRTRVSSEGKQTENIKIFQLCQKDFLVFFFPEIQKEIHQERKSPKEKSWAVINEVQYNSIRGDRRCWQCCRIPFSALFEDDEWMLLLWLNGNGISDICNKENEAATFTNLRTLLFLTFCFQSALT